MHPTFYILTPRRNQELSLVFSPFNPFLVGIPLQKNQTFPDRQINATGLFIARAVSERNEDMKVFIVDDSAIVVERLRNFLAEIEGVEFVGQAQNAGNAIKAIMKLKPDVVILDIRLAGGNGMNVLEKIKKEQPLPVIIMLTNYPYPQYRSKCKELGADYFFDKVTEIEKIAEVFEQLTKEKKFT